MIYDKLVRDKIPGIIEDSGKQYRAHTADSPEYEKYLIKKMKEELQEFEETPCLAEAADIYEVFLAMLGAWNLSFSDVQSVAEHKKEINGAFGYGIILDEILEE